MDPQYKTFTLPTVNGGLIARYVEDRAPDNSYLDLTNFESRKENSLSTRYGTAIITASGASTFALGSAVHTLARMKSLSSIYNYAGAGSSLFRKTGDAAGAYTSIATGLSGSRFSTAVYRPDGNSFPYTFIADSLIMRKDNGSFGTAQQWGIFPPTIPPTVVVQDAAYKLIEEFLVNAGFTFVNYTGVATGNRVNTTLSNPVSSTGVGDATPASMANIAAGMLLNIDTAGNAEMVYVISITATTFRANFTKTHLAAVTVNEGFINGSIAAGTTATITKTAAFDLTSISGQTSTDADLINLWMQVADPASLTEVRVMFDVGDGSFTQDFYWKAVAPSALNPAASGAATSTNTLISGVYGRAVGSRRLTRLGVQDSFQPFEADDFDLLTLQQLDLATGLNRWTQFVTAKSDFFKMGLAGAPGHTWANVSAFRIQIKTSDTASGNLIVSDLFLSGASNLDVFGGVPYDYRITYYNANTFAESNPSQTLVTTVSPRRQAVLVSWSASSDTQVTHVRVYRRGGTLPTGWLKVAEVAIGTTSFRDTLADTVISTNKILEIDNDPPVTSTMRTPVDTTLSAPVTAGSTQTVAVASTSGLVANQYVTLDLDTVFEETVILQSVGVGTITAYFQFPHTTNTRVQASTTPGKAMNICATAFNRNWLAGDADNPHFLYYSKAQRPESFSPANSIEVGTPDDPIMAIIAFRGQLYVFTQKTAYIVLGAGTPVPIPVPTGCTHGMVANFCWCIVEGAIWYLSYDGIYIFRGAESQLVSDKIDWIVTGKNLGPIVAMDQTQRASAVMAYVDKEVYLAYQDTNGARRRMVWSNIYKRWRPDDVPANCMLYAQDTGVLWFGKTNGHIFNDRSGDSDQTYAAGNVTSVAIPYTLQTPYLDEGMPKNDKVFNEFTLDFDSQGQNVTVQLLFNLGATTINLGTVSASGRTQFNVNINAGQGQLAKNISVKITGSATSAVIIYGLHVRGTIEAELRKSFDTYLVKYGTDEWKVVKQGYFEYIAPDVNGVSFSCYLEGSTTAQFTFSLPQATVRTVKRVRFPAVKAKIYRWVATSQSDFRIYQESHFEVKPVCSQKGYQPVKLMEAV